MPRRRRADRTPLGRLRQLFLTGLAVMLPLIITVWLLKLLFGIVHGVSTPIILDVLRLLRMPFVDDPAFVTYLAPLIGVVVTLLVIVLVGLLTTNLLGRQIVAAFDRLMLRIPLIKGIYGGVQQIFDAFRGKNAAFRRVVAVEYPRAGVYTLGFVTREEVVMHRPEGRPLAGYTLVFLPTSPNPTSGWMAAVPDAEVIPLDLSVEEGVKLIVSGGLVVPQTWDRR